MTINPIEQDNEKRKTDEAWTRLQGKLAEEPVNPAWTAWGQNAALNKLNTSGASAAPYQPETAPQDAEVITLVKQQEREPNTAKNAARTRRRKMSRHSKWAAAAAGVAVFAAILATPVGNTAMASILNQFRMQEVTVVNENELRNLFYQVTENGEAKESINKFGTFTYALGTAGRDLPADQIPAALGYAPIASLLTEKGDNVFVNPFYDITLNLHVDEVNKAMKRLGAEQLLPESVDGKPITLHIPESLHYNLAPDQDHWADLSQMNIPTVTVDPSIKVEEALEAVINFPLLPDHLKTSLKESRILSGEIPLPVIADDSTERINVGNTSVILKQYEYGQGAVYNATWVQDGQLFQFNGGNVYPEKEKFIAKLQELIGS